MRTAHQMTYIPIHSPLPAIRHLIETRYGGRVTEEDWTDLSRPVYTIYQDRRSKKKTFYVGKTSVRTQIAFHTREQARLFLTDHPHLISQYMNA